MLGLDSLEVARFLGQLSAEQRGCLMLDYDGTLAPFTVERTEAVPYSGVRDALQHIVAEGKTFLGVVSGRAVQVVRQLLGLSGGIEYWGSHGAERLDVDGGYWSYDLSEEQAHGLARALRAVEALVPAAHIESKPFSLALHWRGVDIGEAAKWDAEVTRLWQEFAAQASLAIHRFDGGVEIRPLDATKADAVRSMLARAGDGCPAAYLGDDITDEDAFSAMPGGNLSVLVGDEARESAASVFLRRPDEVLEFLYRWHAKCR